MKNLFSLFLFFTVYQTLYCQEFNYEVKIEPEILSGMPGLHSFAFAKDGNKWLLVGGRKDGIHERQPFAAFPASANNTNFYVVDIDNKKVWSVPISTLSAPIMEQLQSTNMNFLQVEDTLYLIGGYAFSATANDHITFPNLSTIIVSKVIQSIMDSMPFNQYIKQISDPQFAVTGGQLGKINNTFYLIGGHNFSGRYNPFGHSTFTQAYTNQIRKFKINNSGSSISFSNIGNITDPVNLRRRDFNLLPQILHDGSEGYMISSGVFQLQQDLPFLYPVFVEETGIKSEIGFNQYLSNYHSAKASLYNSLDSSMHMLFFGGISQYYYNNGTLVQDNLVPFVKTISRLTRSVNGNLTEYVLPVEMPGLEGAGAEFILAEGVSHYSNKVIKMQDLNVDTTIIGYIVGGISSPALNPFSSNLASTTSAADLIYTVKLISKKNTAVYEINGKNPYKINVYPNPARNELNIEFEIEKQNDVYYLLTTNDGRIIKQGNINNIIKGNNKHRLQINNSYGQLLNITLIFEGKYFVTEQIVLQ